MNANVTNTRNSFGGVQLKFIMGMVQAIFGLIWISIVALATFFGILFLFAKHLVEKINRFFEGDI